MKRTLALETVQKEAGESVLLQGWVHRVRRVGEKLVFATLRDRSEIVQLVFYKPDLDEATATLVDEIRPEWVIQVEGVVQKREGKQANEEMATGTVEIGVQKVAVLNEAETTPFEIDQDTLPVNEELRLKYRYLDLRTARMQRNMRERDRIITFLREYMHKNDFVEIETPMLMKGTPEGSREYLVPSRVHAGEFFALPQSPQQYKQLCMVAGFERYFQMARCMRDEDLRGDRQPEFTQFDYEMSFVTQEEVLSYTEEMFVEMVQKLYPEKKISKKPFLRMTYAECMEKYGTDKPDLRENKEDPNELAFVWILDFPMFEKDGEGNIAAMHHPFCSVKEEDKEKFMKGEDLYGIRANAYDLVLNGYELSSGSIRIHKSDEQKQVFKLMNISEEEQQAKFAHILEAFKYGAPPHGGFAPGIDRIVMLMMAEPNIREVIAFPKKLDTREPMTGAPTPMPKEVLDEVHIEVTSKDA